MAIPTLQTSFNSGELSPYMRGRTDLQVYANGCKELTNFLPLPQGGIQARTGTKFLYNTGLTTGNVRMLEFAPNSTVSYVLLLSDSKIDIYKNGTAAPVQTIATSPYLNSEVLEVDVEYQVDVMYMTHPNHKPQVLTYTGSDTFTLGNLFDAAGFEAPPFQKEDTSGVELVLSDEVYYLTLTSDTAGDWNSAITAGAGNFNTNKVYVELKVKNDWALYRILDTNTTPAAPADPIAGDATIYVEPVTAVVEDLAPTAQLVHLDSSYYDNHPEISGGEFELRSDTLVWNFDLVNAFVRFENSYPKVKDGLGSGGATAQGTYWVQLLEYLGQEEFPTEWIVNPSSTDLEQGEVYKIVSSTGLQIDNAAPAKNDPQNPGPYTRANADWVYAFRYSTVGDTFAATNHFRVNAGTGTLANLSTNATFDVMRTSDTLSVFTPSGNVTFNDDAEVHEAVLTASRNFFAFGGADGVEEDQYLMIKYASNWVTVKVGTPTSLLSAPVTVLDVIPTEKSSSELSDNGRSSLFRVSAWKDADYPYSVAIHEQRLVFGGSPSFPETVWFSKSTNNYDFRTVEYEGEVVDTSGITYNLGGRAYNRIRSMTSGPTLIIATEGAEWQLRPNNFGEALTPTNIRLSQETYIGSTLRAIRAGSSVFFVERSGRYLREMQFDYQIDGFKSVDLNILADHLFRNDKIVDFVYQQTPRSIFWLVTESGLLYSLTYEKERDVYSWARHRTDSADSVKAVSVFRRTNDTPQDKLALIVERGGAYLIEEMTVDFTDDGSDNYKPYLWQMDSAVRSPAAAGTYSGTEKTVTGVTAAKPGVVTVASHGWLDGQKVLLRGTGVGVLDDRVVTVKNPGANSFEAYDEDGVTPIDCRDKTDFTITGSSKIALNSMKLTIGAHDFEVGDQTTIYDASGGTLIPAAYSGGTVTALDATSVTVSTGSEALLGGTYDYTGLAIYLRYYTDTYVSGGTAVAVTSAVSGLDHLNGRTVGVIVDGAYVGTTLVASGAIDTATVFNRYSEKYILVGLEYTSKVVTLPNALAVRDKGSYYGQRSRVAKLGMYLYESIGLTYGQEGDEGQAINFHNTVTTMDQSPPLFTGFKNDFTVDSSFDLAKEIFIQQDQPYPLTVLALIPELAS